MKKFVKQVLVGLVVGSFLYQDALPLLERRAVPAKAVSSQTLSPWLLNPVTMGASGVDDFAPAAKGLLDDLRAGMRGEKNRIENLRLVYSLLDLAIQKNCTAAEAGKPLALKEGGDAAELAGLLIEAFKFWIPLETNKDKGAELIRWMQLAATLSPALRGTDAVPELLEMIRLAEMQLSDLTLPPADETTFQLQAARMESVLQDEKARKKRDAGYARVLLLINGWHIRDLQASTRRTAPVDPAELETFFRFLRTDGAFLDDLNPQARIGLIAGVTRFLYAPAVFESPAYPLAMGEMLLTRQALLKQPSAGESAGVLARLEEAACNETLPASVRVDSLLGWYRLSVAFTPENAPRVAAAALEWIGGMMKAGAGTGQDHTRALVGWMNISLQSGQAESLYADWFSRLETLSSDAAFGIPFFLSLHQTWAQNAQTLTPAFLDAYRGFLKHLQDTGTGVQPAAREFVRQEILTVSVVGELIARADSGSLTRASIDRFRELIREKAPQYPDRSALLLGLLVSRRTLSDRLVPDFGVLRDKGLVPAIGNAEHVFSHRGHKTLLRLARLFWRVGGKLHLDTNPTFQNFVRNPRLVRQGAYWILGLGFNLILIFAPVNISGMAVMLFALGIGQLVVWVALNSSLSNFLRACLRWKLVAVDAPDSSLSKREKIGKRQLLEFLIHASTIFCFMLLGYLGIAFGSNWAMLATIVILPLSVWGLGLLARALMMSASHGRVRRVNEKLSDMIETLALEMSPLLVYLFTVTGMGGVMPVVMSLLGLWLIYKQAASPMFSPSGAMSVNWTAGVPGLQFGVEGSSAWSTLFEESGDTGVRQQTLMRVFGNGAAPGQERVSATADWKYMYQQIGERIGARLSAEFAGSVEPRALAQMVEYFDFDVIARDVLARAGAGQGKDHAALDAALAETLEDARVMVSAVEEGGPGLQLSDFVSFLAYNRYLQIKPHLRGVFSEQVRQEALSVSDRTRPLWTVLSDSVRQLHAADDGFRADVAKHPGQHDVAANNYKSFAYQQFADSHTDAVGELVRNSVHADQQRYLAAERERRMIKVELGASEFTVTDNGIGMSMDEVINVLLSFNSSGEKQLLRKTRNFGLGFFSVFSYLEADGDRIQVDTFREPGKPGVRVVVEQRNGRPFIQLRTIANPQGIQGTIVRVRGNINPDTVEQMLRARFRFCAEVGIELVRTDRPTQDQPWVNRDPVTGEFFGRRLTQVPENPGKMPMGADGKPKYDVSSGFFLGYTPTEKNAGTRANRSVFVTIDQLTVLESEVPGFHGPAEVVVPLPDGVRVDLSRRQVASDVGIYKYLWDMIDQAAADPARAVLLLDMLYPVCQDVDAILAPFLEPGSQPLVTRIIAKMRECLDKKACEVLPEVEALAHLDCTPLNEYSWKVKGIRPAVYFVHPELWAKLGRRLPFPKACDGLEADPNGPPVQFVKVKFSDEAAREKLFTVFGDIVFVNADVVRPVSSGAKDGKKSREISSLARTALSYELSLRGIKFMWTDKGWRAMMRGGRGTGDEDQNAGAGTRPAAPSAPVRRASAPAAKPAALPSVPPFVGVHSEVDGVCTGQVSFVETFMRFFSSAGETVGLEGRATEEYLRRLHFKHPTLPMYQMLRDVLARSGGLDSAVDELGNAAVVMDVLASGFLPSDSGLTVPQWLRDSLTALRNGSPGPEDVFEWFIARDAAGAPERDNQAIAQWFQNIILEQQAILSGVKANPEYVDEFSKIFAEINGVTSFLKLIRSIARELLKIQETGEINANLRLHPAPENKTQQLAYLLQRQGDLFRRIQPLDPIQTLDNSAYGQNVDDPMLWVREYVQNQMDAVAKAKRELDAKVAAAEKEVEQAPASEQESKHRALEAFKARVKEEKERLTQYLVTIEPGSGGVTFHSPIAIGLSTVFEGLMQPQASRDKGREVVGIGAEQQQMLEQLFRGHHGWGFFMSFKQAKHMRIQTDLEGDGRVLTVDVDLVRDKNGRGNINWEKSVLRYEVKKGEPIGGFNLTWVPAELEGERVIDNGMIMNALRKYGESIFTENLEIMIRSPETRAHVCINDGQTYEARAFSPKMATVYLGRRKDGKVIREITDGSLFMRELAPKADSREPGMEYLEMLDPVIRQFALDEGMTLDISSIHQLTANRTDLANKGELLVPMQQTVQVLTCVAVLDWFTGKEVAFERFPCGAGFEAVAGALLTGTIDARESERLAALAAEYAGLEPAGRLDFMRRFLDDCALREAAAGDELAKLFLFLPSVTVEGTRCSLQEAFALLRGKEGDGYQKVIKDPRMSALLKNPRIMEKTGVAHSARVQRQKFFAWLRAHKSMLLGVFFSALAIHEWVLVGGLNLAPLFTLPSLAPVGAAVAGFFGLFPAFWGVVVAVGLGVAAVLLLVIAVRNALKVARKINQRWHVTTWVKKHFWQILLGVAVAAFAAAVVYGLTQGPGAYLDPVSRIVHAVQEWIASPQVQEFLTSLQKFWDDLQTQVAYFFQHVIPQIWNSITNNAASPNGLGFTSAHVSAVVDVVFGGIVSGLLWVGLGYTVIRRVLGIRNLFRPRESKEPFDLDRATDEKADRHDVYYAFDRLVREYLSRQGYEGVSVKYVVSARAPRVQVGDQMDVVVNLFQLRRELQLLSSAMRQNGKGAVPLGDELYARLVPFLADDLVSMIEMHIGGTRVEARLVELLRNPAMIGGILARIRKEETIKGTYEAPGDLLREHASSGSSDLMTRIRHFFMGLLGLGNLTQAHVIPGLGVRAPGANSEEIIAYFDHKYRTVRVAGREQSVREYLEAQKLSQAQLVRLYEAEREASFQAMNSAGPRVSRKSGFFQWIDALWLIWKGLTWTVSYLITLGFGPLLRRMAFSCWFWRADFLQSGFPVFLQGAVKQIKAQEEKESAQVVSIREALDAMGLKSGDIHTTVWLETVRKFWNAHPPMRPNLAQGLNPLTLVAEAAGRVLRRGRAKQSEERLQELVNAYRKEHNAPEELAALNRFLEQVRMLQNVPARAARWLDHPAAQNVRSFFLVRFLTDTIRGVFEMVGRRAVPFICSALATGLVAAMIVVLPPVWLQVISAVLVAGVVLAVVIVPLYRDPKYASADGVYHKLPLVAKLMRSFWEHRHALLWTLLPAVLLMSGPSILALGKVVMLPSLSLADVPLLTPLYQMLTTLPVNLTLGGNMTTILLAFFFTFFPFAKMIRNQRMDAHRAKEDRLPVAATDYAHLQAVLNQTRTELRAQTLPPAQLQAQLERLIRMQTSLEMRLYRCSEAEQTLLASEIADLVLECLSLLPEPEEGRAVSVVDDREFYQTVFRLLLDYGKAGLQTFDNAAFARNFLKTTVRLFLAGLTTRVVSGAVAQTVDSVLTQAASVEGGNATGLHPVTQTLRAVSQTTDLPRQVLSSIDQGLGLNLAQRVFHAVTGSDENPYTVLAHLNMELTLRDLPVQAAYPAVYVQVIAFLHGVDDPSQLTFENFAAAMKTAGLDSQEATMVMLSLLGDLDQPYSIRNMMAKIDLTTLNPVVLSMNAATDSMGFSSEKIIADITAHGTQYSMPYRYILYDGMMFDLHDQWHYDIWRNLVANETGTASADETAYIRGELEWLLRNYHFQYDSSVPMGSTMVTLDTLRQIAESMRLMQLNPTLAAGLDGVTLVFQYRENSSAAADAFSFGGHKIISYLPSAGSASVHEDGHILQGIAMNMPRESSPFWILDNADLRQFFRSDLSNVYHKDVVYPDNYYPGYDYAVEHFAECGNIFVQNPDRFLGWIAMTDQSHATGVVDTHVQNTHAELIKLWNAYTEFYGGVFVKVGDSYVLVPMDKPMIGTFQDPTQEMAWARQIVEGLSVTKTVPVVGAADGLETVTPNTTQQTVALSPFASQIYLLTVERAAEWMRTDSRYSSIPESMRMALAQQAAEAMIPSMAAWKAPDSADYFRLGRADYEHIVDASTLGTIQANMPAVVQYYQESMARYDTGRVNLLNDMTDPHAQWLFHLFLYVPSDSFPAWLTQDIQQASTPTMTALLQQYRAGSPEQKLLSEFFSVRDEKALASILEEVTGHKAGTATAESTGSGTGTIQYVSLTSGEMARARTELTSIVYIDWSNKDASALLGLLDDSPESVNALARWIALNPANYAVLLDMMDKMPDSEKQLHTELLLAMMQAINHDAAWQGVSGLSGDNRPCTAVTSPLMSQYTSLTGQSTGARTSTDTGLGMWASMTGYVDPFMHGEAGRHFPASSWAGSMTEDDFPAMVQFMPLLVEYQEAGNTSNFWGHFFHDAQYADTRTQLMSQFAVGIPMPEPLLQSLTQYLDSVGATQNPAWTAHDNADHTGQSYRDAAQVLRDAWQATGNPAWTDILLLQDPAAVQHVDSVRGSTAWQDITSAQAVEIQHWWDAQNMSSTSPVTPLSNVDASIDVAQSALPDDHIPALDVTPAVPPAAAIEPDAARDAFRAGAYAQENVGADNAATMDLWRARRAADAATSGRDDLAVAA